MGRAKVASYNPEGGRMKDISRLLESVIAQLEQPQYADLPQDLIEELLTAEARDLAERSRARESVQALIAQHCIESAEQ